MNYRLVFSTTGRVMLVEAGLLCLPVVASMCYAEWWEAIWFMIASAVALAATAPSACNRQHARVHVIDDPSLRERLFALQGGTRGFGADADKALVVTADLSAVRWGWERHDAYVNGGIFVMNLCYALHYHGIAHCILHWSVEPATDREAHRLLGIPENEAIAQVLACGMPPEEFDVAASPRRAPEEIVTWHGGTGK